MVSAIILAYNRCFEVLFTIDKLKEYRQTLPFEFEIIVIDNGSVDDTTPQIKKNHPNIKLITKEKNNGIAGWNEGFKVAKNKYFLVLDDDSHIQSGLTEAINYMELNNDIGIIALNIEDGLLREHSILANSKWKDKQEIEGFIGCGAIIKREVYEKIGGFAEWIYVYTHEFEYSLRCLYAGYEIRFFQNAVVCHRTNAANRTNRRIRLFATRNEMALVYKFFPKRRWRYILRVWANNMKLMKAEGFASGYNIILGGMEFLKMRKNLKYTPVSMEVQKYFTDRCEATRPIFAKVLKEIFH